MILTLKTSRDMKCTLSPGIESISGSVKGLNGSRLIFKTFRRPSVNRPNKTETRVYLSQKKKRTKPLSDKEIACREWFSAARAFAANLSDEQRQQYHDEWKRSDYLFNGKTYATLKGYIMARFYAENLPTDLGLK
jgi:hypothetical protein